MFSSNAHLDHSEGATSLWLSNKDQEIIGASCRVCKSVVMDNPHLLVPCGHSFCLPCLSDELENCPTCRQRVQAKVRNMALSSVARSYVSNIPDELETKESLGAKYRIEEKKIQTRLDLYQNEYENITKELSQVKGQLEIQVKTRTENQHICQNMIEQIEAMKKELSLRRENSMNLSKSIPQCEEKAFELDHKRQLLEETIFSLEKKLENVSSFVNALI